MRHRRAALGTMRTAWPCSAWPCSAWPCSAWPCSAWPCSAWPCSAWPCSAWPCSVQRFTLCPMPYALCPMPYAIQCIVCSPRPACRRCYTISSRALCAGAARRIASGRAAMKSVAPCRARQEAKCDPPTAWSKGGVVNTHRPPHFPARAQPNAMHTKRTVYIPRLYTLSVQYTVDVFGGESRCAVDGLGEGSSRVNPRRKVRTPYPLFEKR